jgi:hypothetical protein
MERQFITTIIAPILHTVLVAGDCPAQRTLEVRSMAYQGPNLYLPEQVPGTKEYPRQIIITIVPTG